MSESDTQPRKRRSRRRDWEQFIATWQTSTTVAEVCEKTGYKDTTARRYAWQLRKRGVDLRRQGDENPQRTKDDWERLRRLAESLTSQDEPPPEEPLACDPVATVEV